MVTILTGFIVLMVMAGLKDAPNPAPIVPIATVTGAQ